MVHTVDYMRSRTAVLTAVFSMQTLLYSEDPLDVQIRGEWAMSRPAQFISYCMAYVEDREQEGWGDGGSLDIMKSRIARANKKSEQEMRKHLQEFRDRHKAPRRLRTDGHNLCKIIRKTRSLPPLRG